MKNTREIKDKELLAMQRELDALRKVLWVVKKLDEPIQRGWAQFYILSEKALRHKDKAMLNDILVVIGSTVYCKRPDFRRYGWTRRRRQLAELYQPLKCVSKSEWEHKNYPDTWRKYFQLQIVHGHNYWYLAYVCDHTGFFELKTEPHIVDEVKVTDPAVERRIAELKRRIETRNLMPRLDWLRGNRRAYWRDDPRFSLRENVMKREVRNALANYPEVDPASSRVRSPISLLITLFPA